MATSSRYSTIDSLLYQDKSFWMTSANRNKSFWMTSLTLHLSPCCSRPWRADWKGPQQQAPKPSCFLWGLATFWDGTHWQKNGCSGPWSHSGLAASLTQGASSHQGLSLPSSLCLGSGFLNTSGLGVRTEPHYSLFRGLPSLCST